jgi:phage-related protein
MSTIEGSATATKAAWENVITAIGSGEGIAEATEGLIGALFGESEGEGFINQIIPRIETIVDGIGTFLVEASPRLLEALASVVEIIASAIPEAVTTIFPVLGQAASSVASTLFTFLIENLPTLISAGMSMLQSLVDGIVSNLPTLISTGYSMLAQLVATIISYLPELLTMGVQLITSLVNGIIESIPAVLSGVGEVLQSAWEAFKDFDWLSLGKSIIDGIVSGITNFGGAIWNALKGAVSGAFNGVKKFFQIGSPSKLMKNEIGRFIPQGIAVGIEADADSVTDAMQELSNMTMDAYDPSFSTSVPTPYSDTAIVDAINELKATMTQMQIVLDSGKLVGELTPALDTSLGNRAIYSGRGI